MNALVITNLFPSKAEPTKGLFNLRGFAALAEHCDVQLISPVSGWRPLMTGVFARSSSGQYGRIRAEYAPYWPIPRIPSSSATAMYHRLKPRVDRMHATNPIDAILGAFAYPDGVAAARIAGELRLPYVSFVLGSDINVSAQDSRLRPHIVRSLLSASSIIAVSKALKARVVELGIPEERVLVQYNGVEGDVFMIRDPDAARAAVRFVSKKQLVCFVGNLVPEKGPDIFVDALARLPDVEGVVIGDGPLRQPLIERSERLGLGNRIRFVGRLAPTEVALWLSASSALCLSSRREGCPNVVLEALASGRPVVATRVGGVPEILRDDNGMMVEPDNPIAFADTLRLVLARPWDAPALRATVPSLSWGDMGRVLYNALNRAAQQSHLAQTPSSDRALGH